MKLRTLPVVALILLSLSGCGATPLLATPIESSPAAATEPVETVPADEATAPASSDALTLLATLPIKGKAPMTGYDRTGMFGTAWLDVDKNGCDTRNDELAAVLTNIVKDGPCKVLTGTLNDVYTGKTINFVRGNKTSTLVQIDHIVALGQAWETGAQQLTQDQRVALANDPINLIAVDGPTNSAKGKGDAATWLPPVKSYRCTYVTDQIQVKAKYGLWVSPAEHDAMVRVLGECGSQPVAPVAPAPAPAVEAPAPPPAAPAAEAPAPEAPAATSVHPGSWCPTAGTTGVAANGKTYTCGSKGPDAAGKYHWNS